MSGACRNSLGACRIRRVAIWLVLYRVLRRAAVGMRWPLVVIDGNIGFSMHGNLRQ
jgi:hypothetical protein